MFERIKLLIGENITKLHQAKIMIIGIGGVGGYVLECLVRSGIENLTIIDFDKIELSNLNRQIISSIDVLDNYKVDVAKNRALTINSKCQIKTIKEALTNENLDVVKNDYDYIIDACDDVKLKIALIKYCQDNEINLISCMGTANKVEPEKLMITTLNKTYNDPLAKKIRTSLPKKYLKTKVLWSSEVPIIKGCLGTFCAIPMVAGAMIAQYVINELLKSKL